MERAQYNRHSRAEVQDDASAPGCYPRSDVAARMRMVINLNSSSIFGGETLPRLSGRAPCSKITIEIEDEDDWESIADTPTRRSASPPTHPLTAPEVSPAMMYF